MLVSRFAYEIMCNLYGEEWVSRFYAPYSLVRR